MQDALNLRLVELFRPAVEAAGLELYHVDLFGQPGRLVVRVFLDKEGGVTLDDCSTLARTLSTLLDVDDPITGRYSLEVSSPGLDRPLATLAHFQRALGKKIKLRTRSPQGGKRKNFDGVLAGVDAPAAVVLLSTEEGDVRIPLDEIVRANVVYVFEDTNSPRKGGPK